MGILIRATCVIGVIAAYSPVHDGPSRDQSALPAAIQPYAAVARNQLRTMDTAAAVKGVAMLSDTARAVASLPPDARARLLEGASGLAQGSRAMAGAGPLR